MNKKILAAFDFDGTITEKDILVPFLKETFGIWKLILSVCKLLPTLLLFSCGFRNRQQVKEKFLSFYIQGMEPGAFYWRACQFSLFKLSQYVRPQALEKLKWHLKEGHQVCIVSANICALIEPYAKQIGVKRVIASELFVDSQGILTGNLKGNNCWGEEKVARLLEIYGKKEDFILYAYGDSRGDKELLQLAEYPYYRYFSN